MMKKVGLLLLSLFTIFGFGVSFANPIVPKSHCYKLKNVEVDNYRVIIDYGDREDSNVYSDSDNSDGFRLKPNPKIYDREREVYEPTAKECTKCGGLVGGLAKKYKVYLLDKSIEIKDITEENIDEKAIFIGNIYNSDCGSYYDYTITYKITKKDGGYELVQVKTKDLGKIKQFPFFWILAVLIETLVLFFIVKLFWEERQISNGKLLLFGIIPTTVTLPLLWFVLPPILGDGILYIVVGELLVAMLEAAMIKYGLNVSWKKSIIASIVCNVFSFAILGWGSLIMDFYDSQGLIMDIPIWTKIYLPVLYFLIEFAVLCISGKMLWNGEQISKKKLILSGIIAPIIMILLFALLILILLALHLDNQYRLELVAILISLFVEMLFIKHLLKVSWKKSIIMVILSILCPIVIGFIVKVFIVKVLFGL